jgi:hypothetical protein
MARPNYLPQAPVPGGITIAQIVAFYCVVAYILTMSHPVFRILTYAIPFFAGIAALASARFTWPPHAPMYFLLIFCGLMYAPVMPLVGWQDLYLMLIGLSAFFFGWHYRYSWMQIFLVSVAVTIVNLALDRVLYGGGGAAFEFDAANSRSSFESPTSFVFGLLVVWAAVERRWRHVLLALLLCVLTLKRIVVLGALVAIVMTLMPRKLTDLLLRPIPMLLLNALFLWAVIAYTQGHLDRFLFEMTGQSANQFGMGRQAAYAYPVRQLVSDPVGSIWHGAGPGGVYDLMMGGWSFLAKGNLHNDSLKILVEYGGIVWVAFFTALYLHRDRNVRILMLFVNILLLTDNTLLYSYVIFVTGLTLAGMAEARVTPVTPVAGPAARPARAMRFVATRR